MSRFFRKHENLIFLACLLLFSAALLANNIKERRQPNFFERGVLAVMSPLQRAVTSTVRSILGTWEHYFHLVDTSRENDKLRAMLREQVFKNNLLREELKKYRRVDTMISKSPPPVQESAPLVASVVAWDASNSARTVVVDHGSLDGVKQGMIVMNHFGLVGRVVTVSKHAARILLVNDARSAVDAYVQRTRARCIVVGQNRKPCEIRYLSVKEDVREGDIVVASGLGGIFPAGIQVGKVSLLEKGNSKLFFKSDLVPSADLDHLEEVLITGIGPDTHLEISQSEGSEEH